MREDGRADGQTDRLTDDGVTGRQRDGQINEWGRWMDGWMDERRIIPRWGYGQRGGWEGWITDESMGRQTGQGCPDE